MVKVGYTMIAVCFVTAQIAGYLMVRVHLRVCLSINSPRSFAKWAAALGASGGLLYGIAFTDEV